MNLRKILSILLAFAMLLTLVGCQFVEDPDEDEGDEVVGGGYVQARDGETGDAESGDSVGDTAEEDPDEDLVIGDEYSDEPYVGDVSAVDEQADDSEEDLIVEEPYVDEDVPQVELQDISSLVPEEGESFYALVLSVGTSIDDDGGTLQVCGLSCNDVNNRGLFTVQVSPDAEILNFSGGYSVDYISDGDIVVITYDGEVLETYPAQIQNATRVYYSTHIDRLAEIARYLPDGYEDFGNYFPAWDDFEY